ncbi:S-adenosyl-L-methionine-dependent methyltransferase [Pyronema domesticum]|nr:S-adenosyl-L-methionine-dependent methyltransferase [Pyronema domesticum]
MRLAWDGSLHIAPIEKPQRILDVGTGTGIWALDIAEQFPMAEVIGTDPSPIQPDCGPANCRFQVDDAMLDWTFKENYFDYVHATNFSSGVSDWNHLVSEMIRCTAPGGYMEISEHRMSVHCDDGTMKPDNGTKAFIETLRTTLVKIGRLHPDVEFLKTLLAKVGFEDIHAKQVKEPVGPWPKDPKMKSLGAMVLLNADTYAESLGMAAFTRVLGVDPEKAHGICNAARLATRNKNNHMYGRYRKPAAEGKIPEN